MVNHSLGGNINDYLITGLVATSSGAHDQRTVPYTMPGIGNGGGWDAVSVPSPGIGSVNTTSVTINNQVGISFTGNVHIVRWV